MRGCGRYQKEWNPIGIRDDDVREIDMLVLRSVCSVDWKTTTCKFELSFITCGKNSMMYLEMKGSKPLRSGDKT